MDVRRLSETVTESSATPSQRDTAAWRQVGPRGVVTRRAERTPFVPRDGGSQQFAAAVAQGGLTLTIAMPAYNEAQTIRAAVAHVLAGNYPCPIELVVVDDGSTDATARELEGLDDERLRVIEHPRNLGKGAALRSAVQVACGSYFLPFDADLEYRVEDIEHVLSPVIEGRATVVYGARLFGFHTVYQTYRYKLGNRLTTLVANVLFDSAVSDLHTCIKLVPTQLLRSMRLRENGFGLDTEITANVLRAGYRPFEVPIHYYARTHQDGKKINWRDGVRCLQVLARTRMANSQLDAPVRVTGPLGRQPVSDPHSVGPHLVDVRWADAPSRGLDRAADAVPGEPLPAPLAEAVD